VCRGWIMTGRRVDLYVVNWGTANKLLRNDAGWFSDVTTAPLNDAGQTECAAWGDYDNDGDPTCISPRTAPTSSAATMAAVFSLTLPAAHWATPISVRVRRGAITTTMGSGFVLHQQLQAEQTSAQRRCVLHRRDHDPALAIQPMPTTAANGRL